VNRDIHPELGERQRVASADEALLRVLVVHPKAHSEGSMGAERSFWVGGELVAVMWPVRGQPEAMWLRVKS
jgi:hypothetical protein